MLEKPIRNLTNLLMPILLYLIVFSSCNAGKIEEAMIDQNMPSWDKISIKTDFQSIDIYSDKDTLFRNSWRFKDSIGEPGSIWHVQVDKKEEEVYLEHEIRDSIYTIVMDMITNPVFTDQFASCYAGNVRICIASDNTELCCQYSSVGQWPDASSGTKELYEILSKKTTINKQEWYELERSDPNPI